MRSRARAFAFAFLCRFVSGFRDIFILWRVYVSICKIISILTIFSHIIDFLRVKLKSNSQFASYKQVKLKLKMSELTGIFAEKSQK